MGQATVALMRYNFPVLYLAGRSTLKRLAAPLYLVLLYLATAATALLDTSLSPALLEVRNILIHSCAFLGLALVMRWSAGLLGRSLAGWEIRLLLLLALGFGLGQEVLQAVIRLRVFPVNSLLDIGVDTTGAALGLWIGGRFPAPVQKQDM